MRLDLRRDFPIISRWKKNDSKGHRNAPWSLRPRGQILARKQPPPPSPSTVHTTPPPSSNLISIRAEGKETKDSLSGFLSLLGVHCAHESSLKSLTMRSPRVSGGVCAWGGGALLSVSQCLSPRLFICPPPARARAPSLTSWRCLSRLLFVSLHLSVCPVGCLHLLVPMLSPFYA